MDGEGKLWIGTFAVGADTELGCQLEWGAVSSDLHSFTH